MPNFATDGTIGANFYRTRESAFFNPDFALGRSVPATGGTRYVYVKASTAIASGGYATVGADYFATASTAGDYVADTAFRAGDYGWLRFADSDTATILAGSGAGATMGLLGHSIPAQSISNTATETRNQNYGMGHWVPALCGQRVTTKQEWNFSLAGATTSYCRTYLLPSALASPCDRIIVDIGINDTDLTVATENLLYIWRALLAAGKAVDAICVTPRDSAVQATRDRDMAMADLARNFAKSGVKNFVAFDLEGVYGDAVSATRAPKSDTGNTYDGLHPANLGSYRQSKVIADYYKQIYPAVSSLATVADQYDATTRPFGNVIPNGILDGTSGTGTTNQGATMSGTAIATGLAIVASSPNTGGSPLSSLTITVSKTAHADGRPEQRIILSGGMTGDVGSIVGLRYSGSAPDFAKLEIGQYYQARVEVDLEAAAAVQLIAGIQLTLSLTMGGTLRHWRDGYSAASGRMPLEGYSVTLLTPPALITATPTVEQITVYSLPVQGALTFTNPIGFKIRSLELRKVIP